MWLHRLLEFGWIYDQFQRHVGSDGVRRYFADHYARITPAVDVLDIGCGPGTMLPYLPQPRSYLGLDSNPRYIETCRQRYQRPYQFEVADIAPETPVHESQFDVAIAVGVLHHLPDDASARMLRNAYSALRPGGRLITMDGVYRDGQPLLAVLLNRLDRGEYVRTDEAYAQMARSAFPEVKVFDYCGKLIVPVSHCVMVCTKPGGTG
jgi:SAM-dependent methyltransferase